MKAKRKCAMVVDDDNIAQIIRTHLLEHLGYNAFMVSDGFQAVKMAKEKQFDLILMDIDMPRMDGIEAAIKIRQQESPQHSAVIIGMTAKFTKKIEQKSKIAGFNFLVGKSLFQRELEEIIKNNFFTNLQRHDPAFA